MLGEFEYLIITAAAGLGERAYGATIREEVEASGRSCSIGALYTTIDRLEAKGLLKTWMSDATPERGGRAKRMVSITPSGVNAAKEFYETVMRISRGASWVANQSRSVLEHFSCCWVSLKRSAAAFSLRKTPIDAEALLYTYRKNTL